MLLVASIRFEISTMFIKSSKASSLGSWPLPDSYNGSNASFAEAKVLTRFSLFASESDLIESSVAVSIVRFHC